MASQFLTSLSEGKTNPRQPLEAKYTPASKEIILTIKISKKIPENGKLSKPPDIQTQNKQRLSKASDMPTLNIEAIVRDRNARMRFISPRYRSGASSLISKMPLTV